MVSRAAKAQPQMPRRRLGGKERPACADDDTVLSRRRHDRDLIDAIGKSHPHVHPASRKAGERQIRSILLEGLDHHAKALAQRAADLDDVPRPTWRSDQLE